MKIISLEFTKASAGFPSHLITVMKHVPGSRSSLDFRCVSLLASHDTPWCCHFGEGYCIHVCVWVYEGFSERHTRILRLKFDFILISEKVPVREILLFSKLYSSETQAFGSKRQKNHLINAKIKLNPDLVQCSVGRAWNIQTVFLHPPHVREISALYVTYKLLLYGHLLIHAEIYIYIYWIHTDAMIKTQEDFFNKIFTSHFIARVRKGLLKVCVGEGAGDRTELKYFDPTLMAVNVVSFSFSWCSTGGPGVHSAGCWLSLLHLIRIFSGPQFIRAPSPFGVVWFSLPLLHSNWNSNCLDFFLDWVI